MVDDLALLDATAQAELVRQRKASPLELVESAIARIEKINPSLNAVILPLFDKARASAASPALPDGPFRGVPFLLKDLLCHTEGDPYHAGMQWLRDLGHVAPVDTYLAAKFKAAGFVILGKTNTPELGAMPTTEPLTYGPTKNPWDVTRSPGGSSGGSAAAVASGMVPAAHGNDGGGSIRIPASACGIVGLKPSRGRLSLGPYLGEGWGGFVSEGVLSRSVRDTAAILDAIAGYMPGDLYVAPPPVRPYRQEVGADPGRLRVGLLRHVPSGMTSVHPECVAAAERAARLLQSLGHAVEEAYPEVLSEMMTTLAFTTVTSSWTAASLDAMSRQVGKPIRAGDVEPVVWTFAEMGRTKTALEYVEAQAVLQSVTRRMASFWARGFDLLLTPTLAAPPPVLGELVPTSDSLFEVIARSGAFVAFTAPFNVTGNPAISLPLHFTADGVPIGVQLVGAYGREDLLLRIASQVEAAEPWAARRPSVHASTGNSSDG